MHCLLFCKGFQPHESDQGLRIFYDAWDVPDGAVSLPRLMAGELTEIRTAHAAWAYETGLKLAPSLRGGSSLSMWWTSILYERHPKISPALYDVYRLVCLEKMLVKMGCDALEAHGLSEPCAKALKALCQARGWLLECRGRGEEQKQDAVHAAYSRTPAPLRAIVRLAAWQAAVKKYLKTIASFPRSEEQTGTVVTYFPNIDVREAAEGRLHSRYWESLHDAFAAEAGPGKTPAVRWLFIRFPSPQGSLEQCAAWERGFKKTKASGVSFNHLEEFLRPGDVAAAAWRWLRLTLASFFRQGRARRLFHFAGSKLDLWPLLGHEYAESFRGWRCLERCLQQRGLENYIKLAGQQRWYIFPMENCPWERMVTHAVRRLGMGPVYGTQHSTVRPTDFRYFDDPRTWTKEETNAFQPDLIAGNGESACAQWRAAGVPEDRLGKIEALRYLYLAKVEKKQAASGRLLVVTSFFRDETNAHLEALAQCLKEKVITPAQVTVKPHPYLPVEEKLRELLGPMADDIEISRATLSEELDKAPAVWASNSTTAVLEAALMGLPVMVMQPVGDFDLCPIQDVPGLIRASDAASAGEGLKKLAPLPVAADYLCLETGLERWRRLLNLRRS